jgi:hypothetical protein
MMSQFHLISGVLDILAMSHMTKASSRQKARQEVFLQRFLVWSDRDGYTNVAIAC